MTRDGSTLLEAVVSVAIVSLAMVSLMGILAQHVDSEARAQARVRAAHLAEQRLETIRALDATDLPPRIGEVAVGAFSPPFEAFRWRTTLRADDASGLLRVDVVVEWDGGRFPLSTRLYRPTASWAVAP